jgi:hypothetical protein
MSGNRRSRAFRALVLLTFVAVMAGLAAGGLGAAKVKEIKKYSATVTPGMVAAGSSVTFAVKLTNDRSSNQAFGSANITLPGGLTSVALGAVTTSPTGRNWFVLPYSGDGIVRLRSGATSDKLSANQWVSVQITATVPCAGPLAWSTLVKQSNDFNGTGNDFTITAPIPPTTVAAGSAVGFAFDPADPGDQTAGEEFDVTIKAVDACGNTATSYSGSATLSGLDNAPDGTPPSYGNPIGFTNGEASASVTAYRAEDDVNLTATSSPTLSGSSDPFDVAPGPLHHFAVAGPSGSVTAGESFTAEVTAQDEWDNTVDGYAGPAAVGGLGASPNGTNPTPDSVSFTNGTASPTVTPTDADTVVQLTVTDGSANGASDPFEVKPAAASALSFDPALGGVQPTNTIVDTAITPAVKVAIVDPFGNLVDSSAAVTVTLSPNPGSLSGTLQRAAGGGVATFDDLTIGTIGGPYTLQASSDGLEGESAEFAITPGPPVKLTLDFVPNQEVDTLFDVTVRTRDAGDNESPVLSQTTVTLTSQSCPSCLGGTTSLTFQTGESSKTFSVEYSPDQNFVTLTADDGPGGLDAGTSNSFNVLKSFETANVADDPVLNTQCADTQPDPVNHDLDTCVTVIFSGGTGTATLAEANCYDGTGEPCIGALIGLFGEFDGGDVWTMVVEYDKSISGKQGVPHIAFLIADTLGGAGTPVNDCAQRSLPNPGEKVCIDYQHRQNDGDSEIGFVGQGDPFIKGK